MAGRKPLIGEDIFTPGEIAAELDISSEKVRELIRDGHMVGHKYPGEKGAYFVLRSDFERFMATCQVKVGYEE